jgi:hypothetical protein
MVYIYFSSFPVSLGRFLSSRVSRVIGQYPELQRAIPRSTDDEVAIGVYITILDRPDMPN